MVTVKRTVHFRIWRQGRKRVSREPEPDVPQGRIHRVSKLMALAIRFERLIREGVVSDQSAAVARHATSYDADHEPVVSGTRHSGGDPALASRNGRQGPDSQKKMLRPIAAEVDWERQRELWESCC